MKLKIAISVLITFFIVVLKVFTEDVVYVSSEQSCDVRQLELACQFYGLKFEHLFVREKGKNHQIFSVLKKSNSSAIVVQASALSSIDSNEFMSTLLNRKGKGMLLLITGVSSQIDSNILDKWSYGVVKSAASFTCNGFFYFADVEEITREIASQKIPIINKRISYLNLNRSKNYQSIIAIKGKNKENLLPIFLKTTVKGTEIFFLTKIDFSNSLTVSSSLNSRENIIAILPLLMFLRYTCSEQCWHSPGHFANLTIDDPWLTDPYGHLSYEGLLEEMGKTNFHTTIAFIPWNYDRSEAGVLSIFHNNPDRFSICIHGNNHDHYEFYKYETKPGDPWPAKPLNVHEANIKQALARMAKLRKLAGLSYDKVMIFPHGIAPSMTLGLLKKYNFLATVNASNVPLDSDEPADVLFLLRTVTLKFENFPSIKRYALSRAQSDIAIDLFLDNPILFYAHHDLFEGGIDAFNETADMLNNIQPDIIWQSLGYIIQHLYLERIRNDGNCDILTFSSNFILENTHQGDLTYFVRKEVAFSIPIKQVTVDGQPYYYKRSGSDLTLEVDMPARESCHIVIEYENDLDLVSVDISKNDPHINRLRRLSDFRDMTLSRNVIGRTISHVYYDTGLYTLGIMRLATILLILIILVIFITFGTWYIIKRKRTNDHFK